MWLFVVGSSPMSPCVSAAPAECSECEDAVIRAVALLPRKPERVVVVDDESTSLPRAALRHVDAFVMPDRRIVYVRKQGSAMQQAVRRGGFFDFVLAENIR
jgi:hypothetical protein